MYLATDLDGTLIPLANHARNREDLQHLRQQCDRSGMRWIFVTGRHFNSITQAILDHGLPTPDWIISDVGTVIWEPTNEGGWRKLDAYDDALEQIVGKTPLPHVDPIVEDLDELRLQEPEKQGKYKRSFYADEEATEKVATVLAQRLQEQQLPYSVVHSYDPWTNEGLIDILPRGVSKAHALLWWTEHARVPREQIVFAGDSGNDLAAFLAGFRTIVVSNTPAAILRQVEAKHQAEGWGDRLFKAGEPATSGVLAGCRHYGLVS